MKFSLAIHGGAGTILRSKLTAEKELEYRKALLQALGEGKSILEKGGSALQAVEASVASLEDCPLFNAGRGSVFGFDGSQEMEAAIMCGKTSRAGAGVGIRNVKNPVKLCRVILEKSPHLLLSGSGCREFARDHQLELAEDAYFYTEERRKQWEEAQKAGETILDHSGAHKFGTVGAVACDRQGNLAAATSTGGLTNKRYGRIGDTPLIGAGTYASNQTCAVSCTGYGEYFIRAVAAYDVAAIMEYQHLGLQEACKKVVEEKLKKLGGEGGLIAVDREGNLSLVFNSAGMYRASHREGEEASVGIFRE